MMEWHSVINLNVRVPHLHQVPERCKAGHWLSYHWAVWPNDDNLSLTPAGDMLNGATHRWSATALYKICLGGSCHVHDCYICNTELIQ